MEGRYCPEWRRGRKDCEADGELGGELEAYMARSGRIFGAHELTHRGLLRTTCTLTGRACVSTEMYGQISPLLGHLDMKVNQGQLTGFYA